MDENRMVRHECAEALGAIATEQCVDVLKKYINDTEVSSAFCIFLLHKFYYLCCTVMFKQLFNLFCHLILNT